MSEQEYICEKAKECDQRCKAKSPHQQTETCVGFTCHFFSNGRYKCIPVTERTLDIELLQRQLKTLVECWEDYRGDWSTVAANDDYSDGRARVYSIFINSLRDSCKSAGLEI